MKGIEELLFGIRSGYAFFYCESQEIQKTTKDILTGLNEAYKDKENGYKVKMWDFEQRAQTGQSEFQDPDTCLTMLEDFMDGTDQVEPRTIVIAKNFNWFLQNKAGDDFDKSKTAWLLNRAAIFSAPESRKVLIIVGNVGFDEAIPEILKRDFASISFALPNEKEIEVLYDFIVSSAKDNPKFKVPNKTEKTRIIAGAKGLTESEIIKVFSYSIIKNEGVFNPKTVEELRAEEINKTPGLKIGHYNKSLDDLKGYEAAKEIIEEWINDPNARGVLILGPAGVGKTHLAQAIASKYNRLVIEMEFAQLMGDGLVGQAEKAMKKALDVIRANANPAAPVIVFIDEIEKGLAGTSGAGRSGGVNDGGTTDRSNAQFLKFLSDGRPEGIYVIATCNDIERLPAAYVRAERWDTAPLFVDLPNDAEKEAILKHYQKIYEIAARPSNMDGWSGAEIKGWCKLAAKKVSLGKDPNSADELIVPISRTMEREIKYLREWKEGRTVAASRKSIPRPTPKATPAWAEAAKKRNIEIE